MQHDAAAIYSIMGTKRHLVEHLALHVVLDIVYRYKGIVYKDSESMVK